MEPGSGSGIGRNASRCRHCGGDVLDSNFVVRRRVAGKPTPVRVGCAEFKVEHFPSEGPVSAGASAIPKPNCRRTHPQLTSAGTPWLPAGATANLLDHLPHGPPVTLVVLHERTNLTSLAPSPHLSTGPQNDTAPECGDGVLLSRGSSGRRTSLSCGVRLQEGKARRKLRHALDFRDNRPEVRPGECRVRVDKQSEQAKQAIRLPPLPSWPRPPRRQSCLSSGKDCHPAGYSTALFLSWRRTHRHPSRHPISTLTLSHKPISYLDIPSLA